MPKILLNPYRNSLSIEGLTLKHDSFLDQSVKTSDDVVFKSLSVGNLTANGNIFLSGVITEIETDNLKVKDSIITLNDQESPLISGGISIKRGNMLDPFEILYNESSQTLSIGNPDSMSPVASREESPINGNVAVWNEQYKRFDSKSVIDSSLTMKSLLVCLDKIALGDSIDSPQIYSNSDNLIFDSRGDIILGSLVSRVGKVIIPANRNVEFNSPGGQVSLVNETGQLKINGITSFGTEVNWGGIANIRSIDNGTSLQISGQTIDINGLVVSPNGTVVFNDVGRCDIMSGNSFKISSIGNLLLTGGSRVVTKNLSIGVVGPFLVDINTNTVGDLTIDAPGDITLNPQSDVFVNINKRLSFGTTNKRINVVNNNLCIISDTELVLLSPVVNVSTRINIGSNSTFYESSGSFVIESSNSDIVLNPSFGRSVKIPTNKGLIFGTTDMIYSDGGNLIVNSQGKINIGGLLGVNIPRGTPLEFGDIEHKIYQSVGRNLHLESDHDINILATGNVVFSNSVVIGDSIIYKDIDNSLTFGGPLKSVGDFVCSSTTFATSQGDASLKTLGGVYVEKNVHVKGIIESSSINVGINSVIIGGSGIPIKVKNSSTTSGTSIEFLATWDIKSGYNIGRGSSTLNSGRSLNFKIPSVSSYAGGEEPSFTFTGGENALLTLNESNLVIDVEFESSKSITLAGKLVADSIESSLFSVTNAGVVVSSALNVENTFVLSDNNQNPIFTAKSTNGVVCYRPSSFLSSVMISGTLSSSSKIYASAGADFSGDLNLNGYKIVDIGSPTFAGDVATKLYVDSVALGRTDKMAVKAASTSNLDISVPIYVVDSESIGPFDRVLLKDQSDPKENGIYELDESSNLSRAIDMANGSNCAGSSVFITGGVQNASVGFVVVGTEVIVGISVIQWTPFSGAATISVANGLSKYGNVLSVKVDDVSLGFASGKLKVLDSFFGSGLTVDTTTSLAETSTDQTHVTKLGRIDTGVWEASTVGVNFGGTGLNFVPVGSILVGDTNNSLQTIDTFKFVNSKLGINTSLPDSVLHLKNKSGTFNGTFVTIEDTDANQSSGILIKSTNSNASLKIGSNGELSLSHDDESANSMISLCTSQLARLTIDSVGDITISESMNVNGSIVTSNLNCSNLVFNSATLLNDPVYGGLLVSSGSVRINGDNFYAPTNATIGNIKFISSVPSESVIYSRDKTTLLPVSLKIRVSMLDSGLCMTAYNGGILVPNTLQLGGVETDSNTGFKLRMNSSSDLEISPGLTNKSVVFKGPTEHSAITLYEKSNVSNKFTTFVDSNVYCLESSQGVGSFKVKGLDVVFCDTEGNNGLVYNPKNNTVFSGGMIKSAENVGVVFGNQVRYNKETRYTTALSLQGTLGNNGWYNLGTLGAGRTSISVKLSFTVVINYDGLGIYNINYLSIESRNICGLVVFKCIDGTHKLYIRVISGPIYLIVVESPVELLFDDYKGVSNFPSNWDSDWILDFDSTIAQPVGTFEVGRIVSSDTANLNNTLLDGNTVVSGPMSVGESTLITNDSITFVSPNSLLSFSNNKIDLDGTSPEFKISTNNSLSRLYINGTDGTLVLSNETNGSQSRLVLSTRGTERLVIDDQGDVLLRKSLNVQDNILCEKSITSNDITSKTLSLFNSNSVVVLSCKDNGGGLSLNGSRITNVADPVDQFDAVNKRYVESLIQGLDIKTSVVAASTVNVNLAIPISAVDNVLLVEFDRILIKNQINKIENGIYTVRNSDSPTRSSDMVSGSLAKSTYVFVEQGSQGTSGWVCTNPKNQDVVGTNEISFVQFSGAGQIIAGIGLDKLGNTLQVRVDTTSLEANSTGYLRISEQAAGLGLSGGGASPLRVSSVLHLSSLGTITSGTWNANVIGMNYGGTGSTSFDTGRIVYSNGSRLTQSLLYFDEVNVRMGINTLSPTSGLTLVDRDIQTTSTVGNTCYSLHTDTMSNSTFALRNDSGKFIISGGTGSNKLTLTKLAQFESNGTFSVLGGVKGDYYTVGGNIKISDSFVEKQTAGKLEIGYYTLDNSGSTVVYYAVGSPSDKLNSEYLSVGLNGSNFVVESTSVSKDLILSTGESNQLRLSALGGISSLSVFHLQNTSASVSRNTGSLVVEGGVGIGGSINCGENVTGKNMFVEKSYQDECVLSNNFSVTSSINSELTITGLLPGKAANLILTNKDSANSLDAKIVIFGKGKNKSSSSEWLDVGFDSSTLSYVVKSGYNTGASSERPVVVSSSSCMLSVGSLLDYGLGATGVGNSVSGNSMFSGRVIISDATDSNSSSSDASVKVNGGLSVNKSAFFGNKVNSPIFQATNRIEYTYNTEIMYTKLTSNGNFNYYNNPTLALNIHVGDSGGPNSTNQEKLYMGYKNSDSLVISSTSTGSGITRDLSLETRYYPNQMVLSSVDGSVSFSNSLKIKDTSVNSLHVQGGVKIDRMLTVGNIEISSESGSVLSIKGGVGSNSATWEYKTSIDSPKVLCFGPTGHESKLRYLNFNGDTTMELDTEAMSLLLNTTTVISKTNERAFVLQNDQNLDVFVFDTTSRIFNVSGCKISNLALPTNAGDAVNKAYVDSVSAGLNLKESANAATTGNISLVNPVSIVDQVSLIPGYRVLVKNQTNSVENGVYKVQAGNYLTRASDFLNGTRASGSFTFIQQGFDNGDKGFVCISDYPSDIVGSNLILFSQFNGTGSRTFTYIGDGLENIDGYLVLSIQPQCGLSIHPTTKSLTIDSTFVGEGLAFNLGVLSVAPITEYTFGKWKSDVIDVMYGGTGTDGLSFVSNGMMWYNSTLDSFQTTTGITVLNQDTMKITGTGETNGIVIHTDIAHVGSSSMLFCDTIGEYSWRLRSSSGNRQISTLPISTHTEVVVSKNGNVAIVVGEPGSDIFLSTSKGSTWGSIQPLNIVPHAWGQVVMSYDGGYILLAGQQDSLYISINGGTTWSTLFDDYRRFWEYTGMSDSGQYMIASALSDGVFVSFNYGSTWQLVSNIPNDIVDVSFTIVSKTGMYQFVAYTTGNFYISSNYGLTFEIHPSLRSGNWYDLNESSNSNYVLLYENPGSLFVSGNTGSTWTEVLSDTPRNWLSSSLSATGGVIAAICDKLYISTDFGATFTSRIDSTPREWTFVCVSSDGLVIFAGGINIPVFMSVDSGTTWNVLSDGELLNVRSAAMSHTTNTIIYPVYNGKIKSYSGSATSNLVLSTGKSSVKSNLTDTLVFTESGLVGIGYTASTSSGISATLDVIGTLAVSGDCTFSEPLEVSSGGIGVKSLQKGLLYSTGGTSAISSTGGLTSGAIPIGSTSGDGSIILESGSVLRSHIGLSIGIDVQAHANILDSLSILSPTTDYFIVGNGTTFVTKSSVQVRSSLGLGALALKNSIDNSDFYGTSLSVSNGGTGTSNFTNGSIPYFNGSVLSSTSLFSSSTGGISIGVGTNPDSIGVGLYDKSIMIQEGLTGGTFLSFSNIDNKFAWKLEKNNSNNFVISGGVPQTDPTLLNKRIEIASNGVLSVFCTTDSLSAVTGGVVISGGLGVAKKICVGDSLSVFGTENSTNETSGSLVVSGGAGIKKDLHVGGIVKIGDTSNATSPSNASLIISGGIGVVKDIFSSGRVIIHRDSVTSSISAGLTIAIDSDIWIPGTLINDNNVSVSLVASGAVVLSMKTVGATSGWNQIATDEKLIWQTSGSSIKSCIGLDAGSGTLTVFSTADYTSGVTSSFVTNGGIYAKKGIQSLGKVLATGEMSVNYNSSSPGPVKMVLNSGSGITGLLYLNDLGTLTDGGAGTMTLKNNNGDLRLQASSGIGMTVKGSGQVLVDSELEATSSTVASLVVSGGIGVSKSIFIGGDVAVAGTFSAPSICSVPTLSTAAADMINVSTVLISNQKLITINDVNTLYVTFKVTPTANSTVTRFTFSLPNMASNIVDDIYSGYANGYEDPVNLNVVPNTLCIGVSGTKKVVVKFYSISTLIHYIKVAVVYSK